MSSFLDEEELEEVNKIVIQTVELTKSTLQLINKDREFHKLQAAHWRKLYEAAIYEGFSQNEAIELVTASLKVSNK